MLARLVNLLGRKEASHTHIQTKDSAEICLQHETTIDKPSLLD